ncbi:dUTP diphosphatase [Myxococcota bacterium]
MRRRGETATQDVQVKLRLLGIRGMPLPVYQSHGAAGLDLVAALEEAVILRPQERRLVPTGIAVAIPPGYEGQVRPRSGLAFRHGIGIVNSPGTIDSDFRGEIGVVLINHGRTEVTIEPGTRIAQLVLAPVVRARLVVTDELEDTERGTGGYGSTGMR